MNFTSDQSVKRLRWIMVGVMLFDKMNTIFGQPSAFWQNPEAANEGNAFVHQFLSRGLPTYLIYSLVNIAVPFWVIPKIPRRLALVGVFSFIFGHYFGACTWLSYRWNYGSIGPIIYGIILSALVVLLTSNKADKTDPNHTLANEPAA